MRKTAILLMAVAIICPIVGILSMSRYSDEATLWWNIWNGEIHLSQVQLFDDPTQQPSVLADWVNDGSAIPLRFVLLLSLAALASGFVVLLHSDALTGARHIWGKVGVGAATVVLGSGAYALFYRQNYDECMVNGMRGQNEAMLLLVRETCDRKYGHEVEVSSDALKISFGSYGAPPSQAAPDLSQLVIISAEQNEKRYWLTRGSFRFAGKECKEATSNDFRVERTLAYDPKDDGFTFQYDGPEYLQCMQTAQV
jgi:hypothetical protein